MKGDGADFVLAVGSFRIIFFWLEKCKALFDYEAKTEIELSFKTGEILTVLSRDDPEWWEGELNG